MFPSLSPHFAPSALSRKPVLMTLNSNPISHSGAFQLPGSSVLPRAGRETCPVLDPSSRGTERSFVPAAAIPDRLVCESGVDVCLSSTFFSVPFYRTLPFSPFRSFLIFVRDDPRAPSIIDLLRYPRVTCSLTNSLTRFRWLHLSCRYQGSCALRDFGTSALQLFTSRSISCLPRHHHSHAPAHPPRRKRPRIPRLFHSVRTCRCPFVRLCPAQEMRVYQYPAG